MADGSLPTISPHLTSPPEDQGKHDYYDVGAMQFPNNKASKEAFKIFKELGLESKLIEYVKSTDNNIRYYNSLVAQLFIWCSQELTGRYRYQIHGRGRKDRYRKNI